MQMLLWSDFNPRATRLHAALDIEYLQTRHHPVCEHLLAWMLKWNSGQKLKIQLLPMVMEPYLLYKASLTLTGSPKIPYRRHPGFS